jgi:D-tyrosyl-tRNA(Tyr) deacylase
MKVLIQRVQSASVKVDNSVKGQIGAGLLVFVGVAQGDTIPQAELLAKKTANLRIFPDDQDRMNRSVKDMQGEVLVISQFTLYASTAKGNRPSFVQAAQPEVAEKLYKHFIDALASHIPQGKIQTGQFRASMQVSLINDGPVTIEIEA